jgi:hypothetical protein
MNDLEKESFRLAIGNALSQVRSDFERMGGLTKQTKKSLHKQRMQNFQNNAFNKGKKDGK